MIGKSRRLHYAVAVVKMDRPLMSDTESFMASVERIVLVNEDGPSDEFTPGLPECHGLTRREAEAEAVEAANEWIDNYSANAKNAKDDDE